MANWKKGLREFFGVTRSHRSLFDIFRNSRNYGFYFSLMDYDEHAIKKFRSLLADYYILGMDGDKFFDPDQKAQAQQMMDGPDGPKTNQQVKDYLKSGHLRVARQIVAKYVVRGKSNEQKRDYELIEPPSMEEVIRFEQCIIRFLPEVEMSLRGIRIQHKFSEIVGNTIYQKYVEKFQKDPLDTQAKVLARRTEIDFMLQAIEDSYIKAADRDKFRFRIWLINFFFLIGTYVLFAVMILIVGQIRVCCCGSIESPWSMLSYLVVPFMGSLGAFISIQQKNESVPIDGDIFRKSLELNSGLIGTCMRLLIGAIFAVLLNLFFVAGYITSSLFPSHLQNDEGVGLYDALGFLWRLHEYSVGEVAKIMTWSLVAGFAERVIPDNLQRLSDSLSSKETKEAGQQLDGSITQISDKK